MLKKDTKFDNTDKAIATTAAIGTGIGISRKFHQVQMGDGKTVDIVGGSVATPTKGSLEFQRDAWSNAFSSNKEFDVRTYGSRLGYSKEGGKYFISAPNLAVNKGLNSTKAMAEIHVSKFDQNPLKLIARRLLKGQNQYRVFTDYGPGSLEQKSSGGWNMMKAHKGPFYTRFIVPGGEHVTTPEAALPNLNTSSIPIEGYFKQQTSNPKNTKPKILINAGGGSGWSAMMPGATDVDVNKHISSMKELHKDTFSKLTPDEQTSFIKDNTKAFREEHIKKQVNNYIEALDKSFGKGGYEVNLLSGPAAPEEYKKAFKSSTTNPSIKFIESVKREEMPKLMANHDYFVLAPGSTVAEVAAMEGYKPRVLAVLPHKKNRFGNHFMHNANWYSHEFGGIEKVDHNKGINTDSLFKGFEKLKKTPTPREHAVRFDNKETANILSIMKDDFHRSKKITNKLLLAGAAGLGAIALKKSFEKKAGIETFFLNTLKNFKGGKMGYAVAGALPGAAVGFGINSYNKSDSPVAPIIGLVGGATSGMLVGRNLSTVMKPFLTTEEGRRLFKDLSKYPSGKEILKNVL